MPASPSTSARVTLAQRGTSRVLLKLSGESFGAASGGEGPARGVDMAEVTKVAESCRQIHNLGKELAVVVGGGNLIRGASLAEHGNRIHESDGRCPVFLFTHNNIAGQEQTDIWICGDRLVS